MTRFSFLSRARLKALTSLALPIIAGLGSQNIMNLVDAMMVGRLDAASLAAVGIAAIALWVVISPLQGLSHGVQAITARRMGEGKTTQIHHAFLTGVGVTAVLGIPYSFVLIKLSPLIFSYLDDDLAVQEIGAGYFSIRLYTIAFIGINYCFRGYFNGRKRSGLFMQTLLIMHPLNICLNYFLIFGRFGFPEMGAEGAALGTAISTIMGSLYFLWLIFRHKNQGFALHFSLAFSSTFKALLEMALPSAFQYLTLSLGFLAFFVIAGMVGTEALAATNILVNLSRVCFILAIGMGMATITLVGNALGENRPREAREWVYAVLFVGCTALGIAGLLLSLFPRFWLSCFGLDAGVVDMAVHPLILLGLIQSYDAAAIILSHAHLGGGSARRVMIISIFNQWLLFIPACFVWVKYFNGSLLHLWICLAAYRFLLFLSFLISFCGKHWKRSTL